jgi:MraZ protein
MSLFLSTYINKVDKKGRVSVPSQFRLALKNETFEGVLVYPSVVNNCLEGCGFSRIEKLTEAIESFDPLSEEKDAFATSMLADVCQLPIDRDGRIILPKAMLNVLNADETVAFVGKGKVFEIWNEACFEKHKIKAKQIANEKRGMLKFVQGSPERAE